MVGGWEINIGTNRAEQVSVAVSEKEAKNLMPLDKIFNQKKYFLDHSRNFSGSHAIVVRLKD